MDAATGLGSPARRAQATLAGRSASPGAACGPACFGLAGLEEHPERPLREEEVEQELDRLESAGRAARVSLLRQREALANRFTEDERRIFDAQVQLLSDPVLEADVRDRIAKQRMSLEGAVKDVLSVYERLFEVVESGNLRNRMSDLRDVAMRLLRHCRGPGARLARQEDAKGGVLVVRELTLSDLTEALDRGIAALVAEAGSPTSHGSILTRAAGLPAVVGLGELSGRVEAGDLLLVDGDTGQIVVHPSREMVEAACRDAPEAGELPALRQPVLRDGVRLSLQAAVASPSEARAAASTGIRTVGLYRTELPVIQRQGFPREKPLTALYRQVVQATERVTFRLPDLDAFTGLSALFPEAEPNPALGLRGSRMLRENGELLTRQLRSILKASEGHDVFIAAPFVTDLGDLRAIRESIDNAREVLRMEGADVSHPVRLGAVIETPSAALLGREILGQADFTLVGVDTLAQHMLAADRHSPSERVAEYLHHPHPVILRAIRKLVQMADALGRELTVYGENLHPGPLLPLLVGVEVRRVAVRPALLAAVHARLEDLDADLCQRVAEDACHAATAAEVAGMLPASFH